MRSSVMQQQARGAERRGGNIRLGRVNNTCSLKGSQRRQHSHLATGHASKTLQSVFFAPARGVSHRGTGLSVMSQTLAVREMEASAAGGADESVTVQSVDAPRLKSAPVLPPSEVEMEIKGVTAKVVTRSDTSAVVYTFDNQNETTAQTEDLHVAGSCAEAQRGDGVEDEDNLVACDLIFVEGDAEALSGYDEPMDLAQYNQELHKLASSSNLDGALSLFNKLRASGVKPNVTTFNHLFRACKKGLRVELSLLESIFRCMELQGLKPNATTYHELLSCYGRGGAHRHAERLFARMKETGFAPDVRMYASLVTAYGRARRPQQALKVFAAMKRAGVAPDVTLFNAVMKAAARSKKWAGAVRLYEELETSRQLQPDYVSFNTAIQAYGHLGQWQSALAIYQDMKSQLIRPTEITYNNLIISCGRGGQWQISAGLFGQMQRAGIKPSVVTYNSLITAYAHSGQLGKCLPVLRKMQDGGRCEPNTVTFNALLTALSQDRRDPDTPRPEAFAEVIEVWQRLMRASCAPNGLTYDSFVGACEAAGQPWENVAATLEGMLEEWTEADQGTRGREILCNLLLCVYDRGRLCPEAHALYAHMEAQGYAPALVTYNALLGICEFERKWERALQILEDMKASGCEPDGITYNAIISTFEECGQWERATDWLEVAQAKGLFKCVDPKGAELDLHHVRSAGTAQTILRWHLRTLRTRGLVDRKRLPAELKVITGWGKHSAVTGHSPVKERVVQLLATIKSPFRIPEGNLGCLVASGESVQQWLVKDEILSLLRFLSGNGAAWRRNFSPKSRQ
eukprot:CAMPEP_0118925522 /NCGR_PEP_ID=MMETSP1169-20130426/3398_1 /TAXON_ID=36882 /ORGANISM="Pyramimonas obovata, Strain CCMP722" /LENGTH=798 /DNA_ID=CAMNT_0006866847 /DNA_START=254 /DNA_END=2650 /DNA_ORIENTATION=-